MRDELIPSDPFWTPSRVLSLLLAGAYVVVGAFGGLETAAKTAMFVVLPLACIWFSDVLADFTGSGFSYMPITRTSPEIFVYYLGWVVLFLPLFVVVWFWAG